MLQELRNAGFANLHAYISEISSVLDKAESTGKIQIPTMTLNLMSRSVVQPGTAASQPAPQPYGPAHYGAQGAAPASSQAFLTQQLMERDPAMSASPASSTQNMTSEQMQAQLANTLSILGIDLSLLNTNPLPGSDKV
jgi:hypothetical protein